MTYIYAIGSENIPKNAKAAGKVNGRRIHVDPHVLQGIQTQSDLRALVAPIMAKVGADFDEIYVGLTLQTPKKRMKQHGRAAKKGSRRNLSKAFRACGRRGQSMRGTVVGEVAVNKVAGSIEEACRQYLEDQKGCEQVLNMRRGGAGGGGRAFLNSLPDY